MIDFEARMREAVERIQKYGTEYAEFQPLSDHLEEMRKVILAKEMLCFKDVPQWKADSEARVSKAYLIHLDGLHVAQEKALRAKARYEAAKASFEALRSLCSLTKKEMETA